MVVLSGWSVDAFAQPALVQVEGNIHGVSEAVRCCRRNIGAAGMQRRRPIIASVTCRPIICGDGATLAARLAHLL